MKQLALIAALSFIGSAFALFNSSEYVLVIDAGHGGHDPGHTEGDLRECDLTLKWAQNLKAQAEARGVEAILLRQTDEFASLADRKLVASGFSSNTLLISIHMEAAQNPDVGGSQILLQEDANEDTRELAAKIESYLDTLKETQVREGNFFMLRDAEYTGMIVSPGFMTNPSDLTLLESDDYQSQFNDRLLSALLKE